MKILLQILAALALLLTIGPPLLHVAGQIELATLKTVMAWGLVLWFATILPLRLGFNRQRRGWGTSAKGKK